MSAKGIGRLFALGLAKEVTRGTAISAATYWLPFDDLSFDEKYENAVADQAVGVIENAINEYRVKNYADGSFKVPMMDQSTGLLFLSLLGTQAVATHSGESVVYDHTFTVGESAQHPSLTLFIHDPLSGTDFSHANGVVHKMDIDAELKKFVQLSCSARAFKGVSQSTFTPSILSENRFIPQYMTFKYATAVAGLSGATAIALKSIKLSIDENIEDQEVLGNVAPADFLNKEFKVEGQLEAIYQNLTDFKNVALATPNVGQAMLIDLINTDVTLGSSTHPELKITLNQVFFSEYSRPIKVKDLVYQTVKFRGTYKLADSAMITVLLTNGVSGTYA
jgi:Phage tail tube protein